MMPSPLTPRALLSRTALVASIIAALVAAAAAPLAAQQRPHGGDTLVVATYAYATNDRLANLVPLARHLERRLGRPVRATSLPDPGALARALADGAADVAVMNTFGYLLVAAAPSPAAVPVATFRLPPGVRSDYRSVVVARRASPPACAEVAPAPAPCTLVLVAPGSTTGNLVPRLFLASRGVPDAERRYRAVTYAGTHAEALARLRRGEGDVAALAAEELARAVAGDSSLAGTLALVWRSDDVALGPVVVRTKLPAALRAAIADAVVGLERQDPAAFTAVRDGWTEARRADAMAPATDSTYDATRRMFGDPAVAAAIIARFAR